MATNNSVKFIDLGLPSGTLWADRNIGADAPEQAGDYFRFGETTPFTEDSPQYCYENIDESIAGTTKDAATVILGKDFKMPTLEQIKELILLCSWEWTELNEEKGFKVTGVNRNFIFLPAAGYRSYHNGKLNNKGGYGYYWSASTNSRSYYGSHYIFLTPRYAYWTNEYFGYGFTIRATKK